MHPSTSRKGHNPQPDGPGSVKDYAGQVDWPSVAHPGWKTEILVCFVQFADVRLKSDGPPKADCCPLEPQSLLKANRPVSKILQLLLSGSNSHNYVFGKLTFFCK